MKNWESAPSQENSGLSKLRRWPLAKLLKIATLAASLNMLPDLEARAEGVNTPDKMKTTQSVEQPGFKESVSPAEIVAHFEKQIRDLDREIQLAKQHDKITDATDISALPEDAQEYYQQMDARRLRYQEIIANPTAYLEWAVARTNQRREEIMSHFQSPVFLEKLQAEWDCSFVEVQERRQRLIENLASVNVVYVSPEQFSKQYGEDVAGIYISNTHTIKFPLDQFFDDETSETTCAPNLEEHELFHAAYLGEDEISSNFSRESDRSFRYYKNNDAEHGDYLKKASERLVRKKILDLELERLNIKKYGETFTNEHYKQLFKMYEDGLLDSNLEEIIQTTTPKDLEMLINDFAGNNQAQETVKDLS